MITSHLKYHFDQIMARGVPAQLGLLALVCTAFVLVSSSLVLLAGPEFTYEDNPVRTIPELIWVCLLHTIDPGMIACTEGEWTALFIFLGVTVGGVSTVGALIGIISAGIEEKMDELRKGRSKILEKGHIAILGWDARVPEIVSELAIANEEVGGKKSRARIAILANRDIDRMEEDLEDVDLRTSSLILRRGDPIDQDDLAIVSIDTARSIIIPAPISPTGDAEVTKTLLALSNYSNHSLHHVVAELAARESHALAQSVAPDANLLCADEIVSQIIAQSVIEPGLTEVYQDLLDFSGSEFYTFVINDNHLAVGMTFAELVLSCPEQVPAGLIGVSGIMSLPAQWDTIIQPGMSVICLSEDDYGLEIERNAALELPRAKDKPERKEPARDVLVFAGESKKLPIIQARLEERQVRVEVRAYAQAGMDNDLARFGTIILLSDESLGVQAADAVAMTLLLRLRNMELTASIIAEILDPKNIELMWSARADDCIASYQLSAYALTQAAEHPVLVRVIGRLLEEEGVRLKVRPVTGYLSQEGTFYDLTEAAMARGEIALGYFANGIDAPLINPPKSAEVPVNEACSAVVLAGKNQGVD
jgi:Trk K+ transport system NAD-binding subunit